MEINTSNINDKYNDLKPYQQKILERFLNRFTTINGIDCHSISSIGMICRKCGFDNFVKNGTTNGVQRYQCKNCKSTQFPDANTPLYNLKLKRESVMLFFPINRNGIFQKKRTIFMFLYPKIS